MSNGHKNESLLMWKAEKSSQFLLSHVQVTAFIPDSNPLSSPSLTPIQRLLYSQVGWPQDSDGPDPFHRALKGLIVSE